MNYYEILKVSQSASQQEIRDSYKNLIKKYHPDIYTGNHEYAEKITKELNDAYKTLSNEETRKEYDLSLMPPETNSSNTYYSSYSYSNKNNYKVSHNKMEYEEKIQETLEEKMKKKIYNIVDKKTSNMSQESKIFMIIIIIVFALFCFAMSIQDYINLLNYSKKQQEIQNQINQNMIINSLQNTTIENVIQGTTENITNTMIENTINNNIIN
ncbi:MAG: J domain-containing protein [Clostridia bacterium]|nr:J domain-containing protein [Clostridia bacterium]